MAGRTRLTSDRGDNLLSDDDDDDNDDPDPVVPPDVVAETLGLR